MLISNFLFGYIASFLGSLPINALNLTAFQYSIERQAKSVLTFAIGVGIVEYLQTLIAYNLGNRLAEDPQLLQTLIKITIPVFLILGVIYLNKKNKVFASGNLPSHQSFVKGLWLSAVNPFAIPYWTVYITYCISRGLVTFNEFFIHFFVIGVSLGTISALGVWAVVGYRFKSKLKFLTAYIHKAIGTVFIVIAVWQLIKLIKI